MSGKAAVLCCCNFTPNALEGFKVALPCKGTLKLALNSDELRFGGTGADVKKKAKAGMIISERMISRLPLPSVVPEKS